LEQEVSFAVEGERLMALLFVLNSEGFFVNNLFQLEGQWQANLTDRKKYWDFGRGESPIVALQAAYDKIKTGEGLPAIVGVTAERSPQIAKQPAKRAQPSALATILSLDLDL
jgi:hypothetical protein